MPAQCYKMKYYLFVLLAVFFSCGKKENIAVYQKVTMLRGADISFLPQIRKSNIAFFNRQNQQEDMLATLKNAGLNTVRLRLWKKPNEAGSDFQSVKMLAQECKTAGLKVLLSVHYSDSWADPAKQTKPEQWRNLSPNELNDSVRVYTQKIMSEINPDLIQIGNEINNGLLWPEGSFTNLSTMKVLLKTATQVVRAFNPNTKIILHFAGFDNSIAFYSNFNDIDYDIIGLSYYAMWHGKNLSSLKANLTNLSSTFHKSTLIAETSYPFTLGWKDFTNNVVGLDNQLIDSYSATPEGQSRYLAAIKEITESAPDCLGFCYWGGEWVSYKGDTAVNGSTWENQAFWDFNNRALPILENY